MGTRCFLALLALLVALIAPVLSYPKGTSEQSHDHIGVSSIMRMLKDQILNRSRGTGSGDSVTRFKGQVDNINPFNYNAVPEWPSKTRHPSWGSGRVNPESDSVILAGGDDFSAGETTKVLDTQADKRGSDYGHGFFFGKRVPGGKPSRQQGESGIHRDRKPNDYNWGMWFGKRGKSNAYGWGGFFGKRGEGDVIEYDDFVA